ncbi:MAG: hypothetical protein IJ363_06030, partial [Clostridia bacterium]|nr:hypothetical protein [Clostridia bacterium]
AFCFAKAYFMVRFFDQTPEKHCPVWNIHSRKPLSYRRFVLDFAFCILNFAFRAQPDKPKFENTFFPPYPQKRKREILTSRFRFFSLLPRLISHFACFILH